MNHSKKLAEECRKRAQKKYGAGWQYLSHEQRQGAYALEVVFVVTSCIDLTEVQKSADARSKSIFEHLKIVAGEALYPSEEHPDTTAP